jgi:hypothetical protein
MPQLFSRMDDINWLTPTIADILDQGAAPPGGDGSIREQMLLLQKKLSELETPARVINVRPTPSYTLFIARPDTVGRLGNRRTVTPNEIRRSLGRIAEEKREWKLGFMPKLQDAEESVGILLRTSDHKPISLRRLLVRGAYRDHLSTMAFPIGNTLEQRLAIQDLSAIGSMLIIGAEGSKQHLINSIMLTLTMLNTPGELRIAIAGQSCNVFKALINTPHALGRLLYMPEDGERLMKGLELELERRLESLEETGTKNISEYNSVLKEQGKNTLPRITLLIDSLSDERWVETHDLWLASLCNLVENGKEAGIQLLLTATQPDAPDIPSELQELIPVRVVTRSVAGDYVKKLDNFHGSLMRFIDAFVIEGDENITPVELCAISQEEIQKTVAYWHQASKQRLQETEERKISAATGVTGLLKRPAELQTGELVSSVPEPAPKEGDFADRPIESQPAEDILRQAEALAAYLGWIGLGPLQDILWMSQEEAREVLEILKSSGIVEDGTGSTLRFLRLTSGD